MENHLNDLIVHADANQKIISANQSYLETFGKTLEEIVGYDFKNLIHPTDRNKVKDSLQSLESPPHITFHEERANTVSGWKWFAWTVSADIDGNGNITRTKAVGRDITQTKEQQEKLLKDKNRAQKLLEIASLANNELDINIVIKNILESTVDALNTSAGMIFLKDSSSGYLKWKASVGISDLLRQSYEEQKILPGEGLSGRIAQTGKFIYIKTNSSRDPRIARSITAEENFNSFIGVPIIASGEIVGVLNILTYPPDFLTQEDLTLCAAIGTHVGMAIKNAQLYSNNLDIKKALEKSEEKYRHLFEQAPAAMFEIDFSQKRFVTVNDVLCQYTGFTKKELLEMSPGDLLTPQSAQLFNERVQCISAGKKVSPKLEHQIKRKDGSTLWAELNEDFIYEGKKIKGAMVVALNISQRKQAENQLLAAKKDWEETFDAIADWVSIIDGDHTILRTNNASNIIVGLSPKQLVGKRCCEIVHGTHCPIPECPGKRAVKTRQRESMELQLEDGRWMRVTADPIGSGADGAERFVHVVRDITQVKKQEQELILAQKKEAFTLLSGGIAHDYNNLLAIIMGNMSLLHEHLTDSLQQKILKDIDKACELAKKLTHQFLTLSEGWPMERRLCPLTPILESAIEDVLQTHPLRVALDVDSPNITLKADQKKLQSAFGNIIRNAAEAMPKNGKLLIQIAEALVIPDMGAEIPTCSVVFADTGNGIEPDAISRIFDPYFTTKQLCAEKGRGLGLSVAKSIITKHGGTITVESTKGKGTTVHVSLPIVTFRADFVSGQIQALPPAKPVVLVMEDEVQLQKLCKRIFNTLGFGTLCASNAEEAFALFEGASQKDIKIKLLFFDQTVSGPMGGAETLRQLRMSGFDGESVLVSGSPTSPEMTDYQKYGFDGRILKPYSKKDIENIIRAILPC